MTPGQKLVYEIHTRDRAGGFVGVRDGKYQFPLAIRWRAPVGDANGVRL